MRRAIALDPLIDTAIGEASDLRYRSRILQAAVSGLVAAISAWRTLALHLGRLSGTGRGRDLEPVAQILQGLAATPDEVEREPARLRDACDRAARAAARVVAPPRRRNCSPTPPPKPSSACRARSTA